MLSLGGARCGSSRPKLLNYPDRPLPLKHRADFALRFLIVVLGDGDDKYLRESSFQYSSPPSCCQCCWLPDRGIQHRIVSSVQIAAVSCIAWETQVLVVAQWLIPALLSGVCQTCGFQSPPASSVRYWRSQIVLACCQRAKTLFWSWERYCAVVVTIES